MADNSPNLAHNEEAPHYWAALFLSRPELWIALIGSTMSVIAIRLLSIMLGVVGLVTLPLPLPTGPVVSGGVGGNLCVHEPTSVAGSEAIP